MVIDQALNFEKSTKTSQFEFSSDTSINILDKINTMIESHLNKFSYCWPKEWLAHDLVSDLKSRDNKPDGEWWDPADPDEIAIDKFRLLAIDYETFYSLWGKELVDDLKLRSNIKQRAIDLAKDVELAQLNASRPIIWVCHSMGGLIVKQMLVHLNETQSALLNNTKAIVFLSTPHLGSTLASSAAKFSFALYPSQEVIELSANNKYLVELNRKFLELANGKLKDKIAFVSLCENLPTYTGIGKWYAQTVTQASADIGIGEFSLVENKDHLNICKPNDKNCVVYTRIKKLITDVIDDENKKCDKCRLNALNEKSKKYGAYLFEFFKSNYFF